MDTVRDNRTSYIGGSDIPTLFGISKFTTCLLYTSPSPRD